MVCIDQYLAVGPLPWWAIVSLWSPCKHVTVTRRLPIGIELCGLLRRTACCTLVGCGGLQGDGRGRRISQRGEWRSSVAAVGGRREGYTGRALVDVGGYDEGLGRGPPPGEMRDLVETYLADLLRYDLCGRAKRHCFCYLRWLDPVDQELLRAKRVEGMEARGNERDLQEQCITQGCMRMGTWRRILQQTRTVATYTRGETARRPPTSSHTTHSRVLVETLVGPQEAKEGHVVHCDGHLQRVPAVCMSPALWSNDKDM